MLGVLLTKWTIRLALACYVAYLAGWIMASDSGLASSKASAHCDRWPRIARAIWTLGCVLFVVHVGCAFHFYHHWSHAAAWRSTAEETKGLLGVPFGDGIYFSYVFLILWVLDAAWLWLRSGENKVANGTPSEPATVDATFVPRPPSRLVQTPPWRVLVHVFLLFIAFHGAIVFEHGPSRWAGIAACLTLGYLVVRRACGPAAVPLTRCPVGDENRRMTRQDEVALHT